MFNDKITFAITTYINNSEREKYLYECIDSIINQTNPNWEILISNDNSPIELNFLKYKNDDRVKIFKQEKNIGMFNGWNFLLQECQTGWFIPMGDDDIVENNMVEKSLLIINSNNKIDCIYFDIINIDKKGDKINEITTTMKEGFHEKGIESLNYRVNNSLNFQYTFFVAVINTNLLKKLGGFLDFGNISDTYISYLIAENFNIFYIKDFLMKIRKHNNNASNNIKKIFQEQYRLIPFLIERFSNNLEKNSIFYLKNLNNTIKKRYFIYILKTLILSNIIIIFKKLGFYSFFSPLWRKYILKQK